jgi:preprotein translocase subunit SecD
MRSFFAALLAICICPALSAHAAGTTLVFDIEPSENSARPQTATNELVSEVKKRMAAMHIGDVTVKPHGASQLSIELPHADAKVVERVKQFFAYPGHLEFRILADGKRSEDSKTIELAEKSDKDKSAQDVHDAAGKALAQWVELPKREVHTSPGCVIRKLDGNRREVLVLEDDCNVTGKYLKRAGVTNTSTGQAVDFQLDAKGGELLSRLTGDNLPQPNGDKRNLAIILDGTLMTTAIIQSRIYDKGEIRGDFTESQIEEIVNILSIRELPARLRLSTDKPPTKDD